MNTLTMMAPVLARGSAPVPVVRPSRSGTTGTNRTMKGDRQMRLLLLLVATSVALAGATVALAVRPRAVQPLDRYHTETVSRGLVTGVLHLPSWLESTTMVRVAGEGFGRVIAVEAAVGQRVTRGQVLARLDARALSAEATGARAQVSAARLGVRHAEVKLGQIVYMLEHGGAVAAEATAAGDETVPRLEAAALEAEGDLVNAVAELRRQSASERTSRLSLDRTIVRAPLDGIVTSRTIETGETITPAAPMFVIAADPTELGLVVNVGENDVSRVRTGGATFYVPALGGHRFDAVVTAVDPAPTGEAPPFRYRVRLRARNDGLALRPGMTAIVALPLTSAPDALRVPVKALQYAPGGGHIEARGASVWLVGADGKAAQVAVKAGVTDGRMIEIRDTRLPEGSAVITAFASAR